MSFDYPTKKAKRWHLVGAGVFEKDDATLLKGEASLLSDEKIGAFDDILEIGLPRNEPPTQEIAPLYQPFPLNPKVEQRCLN